MISYKQTLFKLFLGGYIILSGSLELAGSSVKKKKKKEPEEKVEQLKVGNFSLLASQQPGPLISFGQNMVDKGDLQFFTIVDNFSGCDEELVMIIPTVLYGFRDDFSLYVQLPILAKSQTVCTSQRGVQDLLVQLEWAFYDKIKIETTNQISIVGNITLPFASDSLSIIHIGPRLYGGSGSSSFFIGFTAEHFSTVWYPFISAGIKFIAKNNGLKQGNQFLYQCGLSRNICAKADKYIFNIMLEFDGTYRQQNKELGILNPNSGGNQMLLGPSIWFSTPHFSFQAGISGVIYQHLFGKQQKDNYFISVDVGYKF